MMMMQRQEQQQRQQPPPPPTASMDFSRCRFLSQFHKSSSSFFQSFSLFSSRIKIHASTAFVQFLYAAYQVLASAALSSDSVSRFVFPVYRNAIASLLLLPLAFFLERRTRPSLTLFKLFQFFVCGLIGICINQTLFLAGLYYTSATFAATVQNLTPAITFGLAWSLGIEKIRIRRREGQAKAVGISICVLGATVIALYKGPSVVTVQGFFPESFIGSTQRLGMDTSSFVSWQLGALCLLGNCITWAVWFVAQSPVLRDYPAQLSSTAFQYTFGTAQLVVIALIIERDVAAWATTFTSDFAAVLYGGFVASGIGMTLQGWCAHRGGPVLVAAYQPLQTILVAILSSLFLSETFYLGSLLGGVLIIIGLYLVVWGKAAERKLDSMAGKESATLEPDLLVSIEAEDVLIEPLLDTASSISSGDES